MKFEHIVTKDDNGKTVYSVLASRYGMSSTMLKKIKLYGELDVNGVHYKMKDTVYENDLIYAAYDDDSGPLKRPDGINILYEDDYIAVVDKPAGIVTHPTHGHLDDSLLTLLSDKTLHPVMRLDRETSGLIVVAKNGYSHNEMVKTHIKKLYIAAVYGVFEPSEGLIDRNIKRREGSVMIREVTDDQDPKGRSCRTLYKTLYGDSEKDISLVSYRLLTGRCHQIRVHSLYEGHPLIGDGLYGPLSDDNPDPSVKNSKIYEEKINRQALHAFYLEFSHPVTKKKMSFVSHIPDDISSLFGLSPETCDELLGEALRFFGNNT